MIRTTTGPVYEIRAPVWHYIYIIVLGGVACFFAATILRTSARSNYAGGAGGVSAADMQHVDYAFALACLLVVVYPMVSVIRFRLLFDGSTVTQISAFQTRVVPLDAVYAWPTELVRRSMPSLINRDPSVYEPVMRGRDGRRLLRPWFPPVPADEGFLNDRRQFWSMVTQELERRYGPVRV